mgnify:CR=1 FL=1
MRFQLVVDANPLVAALLGGRAREIIFSRDVQLCSPQATLFEVAKYIPRVARKLQLTESHVFREFQHLPIEACQPQEYQYEELRATSMIAERDPRDVAVLALALSRSLPIWSNDKDFEGLAGIQLFNTSQLLEHLSRK